MKSLTCFISLCLLLISNQVFSQICDPGIFQPNITNTTCSNFDGAIELTVADPSIYTFTWFGVDNFSATTSSIYNLESGFYTLVIENTGTGESCADFFSVENPISESCDYELVHAGCENTGSITLTCSGNSAYVYQWSNGATTASLSGLGAGNYQVTITDNNGCFDVANYVVQAPCIDINPDLPSSVSVQPVQAANTDLIQIDFIVAQFEEIVSLQYTHQYDPSVLQFQGFGNFNSLTSMNENSFGFASANRITFAWFDAELEGVTLPDNAVLYSMYFTPLNSNTSTFNLVNEPTPFEASNSNLTTIPVSSNPAGIVIVPDGDVTESCLVSVNTAGDAIGISGLTSDANTKLFDTNSQIVWSCDPWSEACGPSATINSLPSGSYFLSVTSNFCDEWIAIEVLGNEVTPTCSDGIQNQGETGVDCGGPCAPCEASGCDNGPCTVGINPVQVSNTGQIQIDIVVNDFDNMLSLQYTNQFDPNVLQFQSVGNFNLQTGINVNSNFGFQNVAAGYITFSWSDSELDGINLADGSVLYSLFFTAVNTTATQFFIDGNPTVLEAYSNNLGEVEIVTNPLDIQITDSENEDCLTSLIILPDEIRINGLTADANSKLFDANSQIVWSCDPWNGACASSAVVSGLAAGTYFFSSQSATCDLWIPIDFLGEGTEPTQPTCSDGIQNQGETAVDCGGPCTPCEESGCNVSTYSENGNIIVDGLSATTNAKLFDADINSVWECNPWNGNVCSNNEVISGLVEGATYYVSVQSETCSEWISIVVVGQGPLGNTNECNVSVSSENGNLHINGLTEDANTKLFDSNFDIEWSCDPWDGNICEDAVSIPNLNASATYYLSVQSAVCDLWIPIENLEPANFATRKVATHFGVNELFPNPTTGETFMRIESTNDQTVRLDLFNVIGQHKMSRQIELEIGLNTIQFNVDALINGVYNITITDSQKNSKTIRFVKH